MMSRHNFSKSDFSKKKLSDSFGNYGSGDGVPVLLSQHLRLNIVKSRYCDTLRVSLSARRKEVKAGWEILKSLGLRKRN